MTPVQLVYFKIIGFGAIAAFIVSSAAFGFVQSLSTSARSQLGKAGIVFVAFFFAIVAAIKAADAHHSHNAGLTLSLFLASTVSISAASFCLVWRWSWRAYAVPFALPFAAILILHPKNDPLGYSTMGVFVAGIVFLATGCISGIAASAMRRIGDTTR